MKTALITGGSRGIGRECVRAFARAGYYLAFLYHHHQEEASTLEKATGAKAIRCDITKPEEVQAAAEACLSLLKHVDVLVNNAGIAQQMLFTDISAQQWKQMLDTNLTGAFSVTQALLPSMIRRRYGRIINIGSIWGQVGASCEVHYSAAKAGLIGMTRALAKEVAPSGITVNCVCPGVIRTDMLSCFTPEDLSVLEAQTPAGRLGEPGDVAHAVLFFADENSSFITGQVLGVNGGFGE